DKINILTLKVFAASLIMMADQHSANVERAKDKFTTSYVETANATESSEDSRLAISSDDIQHSDFEKSASVESFDHISQEKANELFRNHLKRTHPNLLKPDSIAQTEKRSSGRDPVISSTSLSKTLIAQDNSKTVKPIVVSEEITSISNILMRPLELLYDPLLDLLVFDLTSSFMYEPYIRAAHQIKLISMLSGCFQYVVGFPWFDRHRFSDLIQCTHEISARTNFADYSSVHFAHDIISLLRKHMQETEFEDLQLFLMLVLIDFMRQFQRLFMPSYTCHAANTPGRDTCFLFKLVQAIMNEQSSGNNSYEFETMRQQIERRIRQQQF
ncbi:hypothetical protein GJ496_003915, partial [Pomphorhynchus laevis]